MKFASILSIYYCIDVDHILSITGNIITMREMLMFTVESLSGHRTTSLNCSVDAAAGWRAGAGGKRHQHMLVVHVGFRCTN